MMMIGQHHLLSPALYSLGQSVVLLCTATDCARPLTLERAGNSLRRVRQLFVSVAVAIYSEWPLKASSLPRSKPEEVSPWYELTPA
jgi:hypothetical protein